MISKLHIDQGDTHQIDIIKLTKLWWVKRFRPQTGGVDGYQNLRKYGESSRQ